MGTFVAVAVGIAVVASVAVGVAVGSVGVLVGVGEPTVGDRVLLGVEVGNTVPGASYAPMSHPGTPSLLPSVGRGWPR
ncbi:MAG TPA: hypothetical protein VMU34_13590 [Mycobacterium sp.]|nr:hypothetical protein [Mycobacterium sp.]